MTDLERAKSLFQSGEYTCVLLKGDSIYTSTQTGISPLIGWLKARNDIKGFSAADKIVGKAAALLFVLGGVKEVYSPVMSEKAVVIFTRYNVHAEYDTLVACIINRQGTGSCPMEEAVSDIDDPPQAFQVLLHTLSVLQAKKG